MTANPHAGRNGARWAPGWDGRNVQLTPAYILEAVREAMGGRIGLDPCTEADNPTRAERFYALPDNGLAHRWDTGPIWCNPPFGDAAQPWILRCLEAGQAGYPAALMLPAATETVRTQAVMRGADAVTFLAGRPTFGRRGGGKPWQRGPGILIATWGVDLTGAGLGVTFVQAMPADA